MLEMPRSDAFVFLDFDGRREWLSAIQSWAKERSVAMAEFYACFYFEAYLRHTDDVVFEDALFRRAALGSFVVAVRRLYVDDDAEEIINELHYYLGVDASDYDADQVESTLRRCDLFDALSCLEWLNFFVQDAEAYDGYAYTDEQVNFVVARMKSIYLDDAHERTSREIAIIAFYDFDDDDEDPCFQSSLNGHEMNETESVVDGSQQGDFAAAADDDLCSQAPVDVRETESGEEEMWDLFASFEI